jgi:hypothetical protein
MQIAHRDSTQPPLGGHGRKRWPQRVPGQLNARFHLQQRRQQTLSRDTSRLFSGLLGAGQVVVNALSSTAIVAVLIVYFLADLPRIRATLYRFIPHSRRPRAILLGDEIFAKVGAFVLGNLITSLIAGSLTWIFLTIVGVPLPAVVGHLCGHRGPAASDRLHHRRRGGVPGGAERVAARLAGHHRLLHRLPDSRELFDRAPDHRPGSRRTGGGHHGGVFKKSSCGW